MVTVKCQHVLIAAFGREHIFKDLNNIPLGSDFRKELEKVLRTCRVVLVIVGKQYETLTDSETGGIRLFADKDWVRYEVSSALSNPDIVTIPILVGRRGMPKMTDLPDSIHDLCYRNAMTIDNDLDFYRQIEILINALADTIEKLNLLPEERLPKLLDLNSEREIRIVDQSVEVDLEAFLKNLNLSLSNQPTEYEKKQFASYSEIWARLQDVRVAGDKLWQSASDENLIEFGDALENTQNFIRLNELFFDPDDLAKLQKLLSHMYYYRAGKLKLFEYVRALRQSRTLLNYLESTRGRTLPKYLERTRAGIIRENKHFRTQYENLLDTIGESFRSYLKAI